MPKDALSTSGFSGPVYRQRTISACVTCRSRKIKCDRIHPSCSQCINRRTTCVYLGQFERPTKFVSQSPSLNTFSGSGEPHTSTTSSSIIRQQEDNIEGVGSTSGGPELCSALTDLIDSEEARIQCISRTQTPQHVIQLSDFGDKYLITLFDRLPPRDVCLPYFENFLRTIHPIITVCHVPSLKLEYSAFWTNLSATTSAELLVLVLAVLYTGAANSLVDDIQTPILLTLYEELLNIIDFSAYYIRDTASAIQLLQGNIIMNTFKISKLAPFSAFGFLPQAIRFAQNLRLHVDLKNKGRIEVEVRRRLWWHLIFLDVESTIASGLQPTIRSDEYTTQFPSIFQDETITTNSDLLQLPAVFSPMMIAKQGHFQWSRRMQMWLKRTPDQIEIARFQSIIEDLLALLPIDRHNPEIEWAHTYLRMQADRANCMLGWRFWKLDQLSGTGCQSEIVRTSRSFLTQYLHISSLSSSLHLSWFVPGIVQPLHALTILLMHISTCSDSLLEDRISRNLINTVFRIRMDAISRGTVVPVRSMIRSGKLHHMSNARYSILAKLWQTVWQRCGWGMDMNDLTRYSTDDFMSQKVGKERDRSIDENDSERYPVDNFISQKAAKERDSEMDKVIEQAIGDIEVVLKEPANNALAESVLPSTLDGFVVSDSMNSLQWDEWESLTAEFFLDNNAGRENDEIMGESELQLN